MTTQPKCKCDISIACAWLRMSTRSTFVACIYLPVFYMLGQRATAFSLYASALLRPDQRRAKRYISSALILQPGRLRARKMTLWEIICALVSCGNTIVNSKLCNDAPSHAAAPCMMACQRPQTSMLFLNFLCNCSGEHCY
jgi:hypothetical protein